MRKVKQAEDPEDLAACEARAYRFLGFRALSRKELVSKLKHAGFAESVIDRAVAKLLRLGYLNDAQLAEDYADAKFGTGKIGIRGIRSKLAQRGVDPQTAEESIASLSEEGEREAALALAQKKAAELTDKPLPEIRRKVYAYLLRHGFSSEAIRAALLAVGEEMPYEL